MIDYMLGVDVWEGNLDIDEAELEQAGVSFLIPRLNSIDGATHRDENFSRQWEQAERFIRWPYFVYNPWLRGKENVEWLGDNLPPGVKRVAIDIEVKRQGYSPAAYAAEVMTFVTLAKRHWRPVIYTGGWFLPILSAWPKDVDYWWGRYPTLMYPKESLVCEWEEVHRRIRQLQWAPGQAPGPVVVWQCSGDRLKPPGCCGRAVDINITYMRPEQLAAWVGEGAPAPVRWEYAITAWARGLGYVGPDPDRLP